MNQRLARRIRRSVYGKDKSIRAREYEIDENGTIRNKGLRKVYQIRKAIFKELRRGW